MPDGFELKHRPTEMSDWPTSLADARERVIALEAEVEQLRAALDDVDNKRDEYALKREPLEAEIERLRESCKQIALDKDIIIEGLRVAIAKAEDTRSG